jgi:hypothetical protein
MDQISPRCRCWIYNCIEYLKSYGLLKEENKINLVKLDKVANEDLVNATHLKTTKEVSQLIEHVNKIDHM